MAACTRGVRSLYQTAISSPICAQCRRPFGTSAALFSGHNKWSKIKHTKGAEDAKRSTMRAQISKNLTLYSKLYGPNPGDNPQLAATLAAAKKAGVPKNLIEQAIARGQGRSTTGASLDVMTYEVMVPPSVALILDVETDNKMRALQDLNQTVKKHGARTSGTEFFFSKMGRVVFEAKEGAGVEEVMDDAIEAGAEDIEADEEGNVVVWSQPSETMQIAKAVGGKFALNPLSSEIIWAAKEETLARIDSPQDLQKVADLVAALRELPDVQNVYSNAVKGEVSDEEWEKLDDNLDA